MQGIEIFRNPNGNFEIIFPLRDPTTEELVTGLASDLDSSTIIIYYHNATVWASSTFSGTPLEIGSTGSYNITILSSWFTNRDNDYPISISIVDDEVTKQWKDVFITINGKLSIEKLNISHPTDNAVDISSSAAKGIQVIGSTYGVELQGGSNEGLSVLSTSGRGMVITGVTDALHIGSSTAKGINISSVTDGINIVSTTARGIGILAQTLGMEINATDNEGLRITSPNDNAVEIASGSGNGVDISSTNAKGVEITSDNIGVDINSITTEIGLNLQRIKITGSTTGPTVDILSNLTAAPAVQLECNNAAALLINSNNNKGVSISGDNIGVEIYSFSNTALNIENFTADPAVNIHNDDTGKALHVHNSDNTEPALAVSNNGDGDALQCNAAVGNEIKAKELTNILRSTDIIDGTALDAILSILKGSIIGKYVKDAPDPGKLTIFANDNVTPLVIVTLTDTQRTRNLPT